MEFDNENDFDYVDGYDCTDLKNEPRPDSVVYQPQFAELKKKCQEVAKLLLGPLDESKYHNIITKGLMQDVIDRTENECSEENLFAVAGDMAAGTVPSRLLISWRY